MERARLLLIALAALAVRPPDAVAEDLYPSRPIRIIVPTAPGGGSDISARLIAQELARLSGQSAVVENRSGAGTIVGTDLVAKAAPDGYTLLMAPGALATNPSTYKKLPYDAVRDFAPITQTLFVPQLLAVHPSVPAKSVKELIALAAARPREIHFAAAGHGTLPHLSMELFALMAGIHMVNVPYKGGAPGIIDLVGGRVEVTVTSSLSVILPHVRTGRVRALGVTSAARIQALPDIPTIAEAGLPGYEAVQWSGLLAPAGTPREIIVKLHQEAVAVLRTTEAREHLAADGNEVVASSPEEFAAFIKAEIVKWTRVAKAAGIEPE